MPLAPKARQPAGRTQQRGRHVARERGLDGYQWLNSTRWRKLREQVLNDNPLCVECAKSGKATVATDVDHVVPHKGDYERFWEGELQPLCKSCHSRKTATEDMGGYR